MPISTEGFDETDPPVGLKCYLVFTYTEKYPDTAPVVEIEDDENFSDDCESQLLAHIDTLLEENKGMEMVFPVVSSAQEWLNVKWDKHQEEEAEQKEKAKMAEELKEQKKFEGTRVTVETFLKWKTEFDLEFGLCEKKKEISEGRKLTGRELFLADTTLNDSDIKFLLAAGDSIENVKIDESLFQNMDDLDLGSDESDDEDWVPGKDDDDD